MVYDPELDALEKQNELLVSGYWQALGADKAASAYHHHAKKAAVSSSPSELGRYVALLEFAEKSGWHLCVEVLSDRLLELLDIENEERQAVFFPWIRVNELLSTSLLRQNTPKKLKRAVGHAKRLSRSLSAGKEGWGDALQTLMLRFRMNVRDSLGRLGRHDDAASINGELIGRLKSPPGSTGIPGTVSSEEILALQLEALSDVCACVHTQEADQRALLASARRVWAQLENPDHRCHLLMGRLEAANGQYETALGILELSLALQKGGGEEQLETFGLLAGIHFRLQRSPGAADAGLIGSYFQQALGALPLWTSVRQFELVTEYADFLRLTEQWEEALELLLPAYEVCRKQLKPENLVLVGMRRILGLLHWTLGSTEDAYPHMEQAFIHEVRAQLSVEPVNPVEEFKLYAAMLESFAAGKDLEKIDELFPRVLLLLRTTGGSVASLVQLFCWMIEVDVQNKRLRKAAEFGDECLAIVQQYESGDALADLREQVGEAHAAIRRHNKRLNRKPIWDLWIDPAIFAVEAKSGGASSRVDHSVRLKPRHFEGRGVGRIKEVVGKGRSLGLQLSFDAIQACVEAGEPFELDLHLDRDKAMAFCAKLGFGAVAGPGSEDKSEGSPVDGERFNAMFKVLVDMKLTQRKKYLRNKALRSMESKTFLSLELEQKKQVVVELEARLAALPCFEGRLKTRVYCEREIRVGKG
jgi:hypothetical protein